MIYKAPCHDTSRYHGKKEQGMIDPEWLKIESIGNFFRKLKRWCLQAVAWKENFDDNEVEAN
mgnify:CR=1 FL=1